MSDKYIYCPRCDYNLHGLPDGDCPECGEPFDSEKLKRSRLSRKESIWEVVVTLVGWPVVVWLALIPAMGFVLLSMVSVIVLVSEVKWLGVVLYTLVSVFIFWVVLYYTVTICGDLSRQTYRIRRANAPDKERWSASVIFWLLFTFEVFVILFCPVLILMSGFVFVL